MWYNIHIEPELPYNKQFTDEQFLRFIEKKIKLKCVSVAIEICNSDYKHNETYFINNINYYTITDNAVINVNPLTSFSKTIPWYWHYLYFNDNYPWYYKWIHYYPGVPWYYKWINYSLNIISTGESIIVENNQCCVIIRNKNISINITIT